MNEPRRPVLYSPEQGTWLSFHGVPSRIVASGSETDSSYCVSVGTSLPGGQASPHSHTFSEGFWINSGTIQFTAGNETLDLEQGSYLHLEGGVAHFPRNVSDSKSELITFCFPAGFEAFQKDNERPLDSPECLLPTPEFLPTRRVRRRRAECFMSNSTPSGLCAQAGVWKALCPRMAALVRSGTRS